MQQLIQIVNILYHCMLVLAAAIAIYRFRKLDRATRLVCFWIWLGLMTEQSAKLWGYYHDKNNIPVYTVSSIVELVIVSMYFHYSLKYLRRLKIALVIAVAGIGLGLLNSIYLQPIEQSNSNFIFLECLCIFSLGLFAIYKLLMADNVKLPQQVLFWVTLTFLFYQCGSLWNWGFYQYAIVQSLNLAYTISFVFLIVNLIIYSSLATIIFLYPKLKRDNV